MRLSKILKGKLMEDIYIGTQKVQGRDSVPLVDIMDRVIGFANKLEAHKLNHLGICSLHRAFSVFLFDTQNRLLLQRRSKYKLTFPLYLTNACCSHPKCTSDELLEENGIGIKRAAIRRLGYELGIKQEIKLNEMKIVSRLRYSSKSSETLGENEIDYCIVLRKDIELDPNPGEVDEIAYIGFEELDRIKSMQDLTPWFKYICNGLLAQWWKNLDIIFKRSDDQLPDIINAGPI